MTIVRPSAPASRSLARSRWRAAAWEAGEREVASECAVAISFNRTTHAVMMASPADLEDFALGFALAEGIIADAVELEELEIVPVGPDALECRCWIEGARMRALDRRRRRMAGVSGCGMCGLESLEAALPAPPGVGAADLRVSAAEIEAALATLRPAQALNGRTGAVHAAGFWSRGLGLAALREDVGRHNALDKLRGALVRGGLAAGDGILLMTSRVSVELVQKAAGMGAPILVAVSAPTTLAIATAERAGITLVGVARQDGFELFAHPERIDRA